MGRSIRIQAPPDGSPSSGDGFNGFSGDERRTLIGTTHRLFAILLLSYLGIAGTLLVRFPPINPDEIVIGVTADNFAHGKGPAYSLNDDIFAASAYALHDVTNQESRLLYMSWVGLWGRLFPHNYIALRWSSLSLGAGALVFLYLTGMALGGSAVGLAAVALMLTYPVFWASSLCINELIVLFFACTVLVWLTVTQRPRRWRFFILGALGGLCLGIHPNIVPFCMGWVPLLIFREPAKRRWTLLGLWLLGSMAGAVLAMARVNWSHFLLYQQSLYWSFARPPIFSWPWHPGMWFESMLAALAEPATYYFRTSELWGWSTGMLLFWIGSAVSLLLGFYPNEQKRRPWALASFFTFVGMTLLIGRVEMAYGLALAPFFIPLIALSWHSRPHQPAKAAEGLRILSVGCFTASLVCFLLFAGRYALKTKSVSRIAADVKALLPESPVRIVGPNFLWLLYGGDSVRDIGALVVSRYYTEGRWNLRESFAAWKPDIVFVNPQVRRIFIRDGIAESVLPKLMGARSARPIGSLEMYSADNHFDLYAIEWPSGEKS